MSESDVEISAYESMRESLEWKHAGKWVLFHGHQLVGLYATSLAVAEDAVKRFGEGPYLIRQIAAPSTKRVLNGPWRELIATLIALRRPEPELRLDR